MTTKPALAKLALAKLVFAASLALHAVGAAGFDLQGHRGARGLAPENTIIGFERALAVGVDTLELDVGISADGTPVISHDIALNPALVRDDSGRWLATRPTIHSLELAGLQRYDVGRLDPDSAYARQYPSQQPSDGERMPTLAALFRYVKDIGADSVRFNIETKIDPRRPADTPDPAAFVEAVMQVVRHAGVMDRVTLQSFDWRTLAHARRIQPGIPTACLTTQGGSNDNLADGAWTAGLKLSDYGSVPLLVKAAGCTTWSPNHNNLDPGALEQSKALGLVVVPWTVNRPADMARLIDWGVDGLITDYPNRLREVMAQRSMPLPAVRPSTGFPAR